MAFRILLVVNAEWYFWSHRLSLAQALRAAGAVVSVAATVERGYQAAIEREGFEFFPLHLRRRSLNPVTELGSIWELFRLYRRVRPDLIHHITIKPVIYGSLAAQAAGARRLVNTIPGLGYAYASGSARRQLLRRLVSGAYRLALHGADTRVIFQNPDDQRAFVAQGLVAEARTAVIRGSGVDIERFRPQPEPAGPPVILLAARLLWDKGIQEFVSAGQELARRGLPCRMVLVGVPDVESHNHVPEEVLRAWHAAGAVEWWGLRDDMPEVMRQAAIVALPSHYPEGVPKVLLEAAAAGRPIVTTDTPGCREIVRHDANGLLVPVRDVPALVAALDYLVRHAEERRRLGRRGREIAVQEFAEPQVLAATFDVYRGLLGPAWPTWPPKAA